MKMKVAWSETVNKVLVKLPDWGNSGVETAVMLSDTNERKLTIHYYVENAKIFVRLALNESETILLNLSE